MSNIFNIEEAKHRHDDIIHEVKRIRDELSRDVIDYYYDDPISDEQEHNKREGMRKYLRIARDKIEALLNGKLY